MRIKLHFEDVLPSLPNNRKICFLVNKEACRRVTDLCYLIKKKFFDSNGVVSLYLDGFYFPPQESINIIQENDMLDVRYSGKYIEAIVNGEEKTQRNKKRKVQQSSSDSLSSDSEPVAKEKHRGTIACRPEKRAKLLTGKALPLSKLGYTAVKSTKEKSSMSSSSSASSSSTDSTESDRKSKKLLNVKQKEKVSHATIFSFPDSKTKGVVSNVSKKVILMTDNASFKKPAPVKKTIKGNDKSLVSSSSSDTSSTDSNDEQNTESKIDFDVFNSKNVATSTPFPTPITSTLSLNKSSISKADSFAKHLPLKDVYKNTSLILTAKPKTVNISDTNNNENTESSVDVSEKADSSVDDSMNSTNNANDFKVSGKTLRNRRRRQKRLELVRNGNKKKRNSDKQPNGNEEKIESVSSAVLTESGKTAAEPEKKNETAVKQLTRDYSTYPKLSEPPSVGRLIAYKILEMSLSYTPELSAYKEAVVNNYNKETNLIGLQLSNASLQKTRGDGNITGRFELPTQTEEHEVNGENETNNVVSLSWADLQDVRLIL